MIERKRPYLAYWRAALLLIVCLHVVQVLRVYPPKLLVTGALPLLGDVSRYYATTQAVSEIGHSYGYDPAFMAGYPVGLWNSMGKKGYELSHLLVPFLPVSGCFYLLYVTLAIIAPLIVWASGRLLLRTGLQSRILFVAVMIYWHLDSLISYFWNFGNVFFPLTCCLVVPLFVAGWSLQNDRHPFLSAVAVAVVLAGVFYSHSVLLLACFLVLMACVLGNPRALLNARIWGAWMLAGVLSLLLVLPWLVPLLFSRNDYQPFIYRGYQGSIKHLIMDILSDRTYLRHFDRTALLHLGVVGGVLGCSVVWRRRELRGVVIVFAAGVLCMVLAYSSWWLPVMRTVQPYRFLAPALMLLLVPLTVFLEYAVIQFKQSTRPVRLVMGGLVAVFLPSISAYLPTLITSPNSARDLNTTELTALAHLEALPRAGRVLCDDVQLGHLVPARTGHHIVGGLGAEGFVRHRSAALTYQGRFLGRTGDEWPIEELAKYLDGYAVTHAMLNRSEWIALADGHPDVFEKLTEAGGFSFYRVVGVPSSLVHAGVGSVDASRSRVLVTNVAPGDLVLKLHYSNLLEASDGVSLVPVEILDRVPPFIKCVVPDGVSSFEVRVRRDFLYQLSALGSVLLDSVEQEE